MLHIPVSCRHLTPMSAGGGAACDGGCQARAQHRSSRASGRKMEVLHRPAGPGEQVRPLGYGTVQPGTQPLLPPQGHRAAAVPVPSCPASGASSRWSGPEEVAAALQEAAPAQREDTFAFAPISPGFAGHGALLPYVR